MSTAVDAMSLARDERADLADFLTTLTPAQWDAPSLCARWRVRDVVAHMFSYEDLGIGGLIGRFVTGGVLPDRVNAAGVAAYAEHSTDDLVALVKDHLQPRAHRGVRWPDRAHRRADYHQDIRRRSACPATSPPNGCAVP